MDILRRFLNWIWNSESYIPFVIRGSLAAYTVLGLISFGVRLSYGFKKPAENFQIFAEALFLIFGVPYIIYLLYNKYNTIKEDRQYRLMLKHAENLSKQSQFTIEQQRIEKERIRKDTLKNLTHTNQESFE